VSDVVSMNECIGCEVRWMVRGLLCSSATSQRRFIIAGPDGNVVVTCLVDDIFDKTHPRGIIGDHLNCVVQ